MINILLILGYVGLNSLGALIIKHQLNLMGPVKLESVKTVTLYFLQLFTSPLVIIGFTSVFSSSILWMIALSRMNISVAYPIAVGLNFLIVISTGILFFKEVVTLKQTLAIICILTAVFLLSSNK